MDADILRAVRGSTAARLPAGLVRAARAGLGLSMLDLALLAGVSVGCVGRVEADRDRDGDGPALHRMRRALEAAGADFVERDGGILLRLRAGWVDQRRPRRPATRR